MTASLQEQIGVAMSGQHWDIQDFRLWQSTDPAVILFRPRQLSLAKTTDGRFQANLSQYLKWEAGSYKVSGGSAFLTLTTGLQFEATAFQKMKDWWRTVVLNRGYQGSLDPQFIPLPVRNGKIQVMLDPGTGLVNSGKGPGSTNGSADSPNGATTAPTNSAGNGEISGITGGTVTIPLDFTPKGADDWGRAIKQQAGVAGGVKFSYEYPQMLPEISARVSLNGFRLFNYFSSALSFDNPSRTYYGTGDDIKNAWNDMVRSGDIQIRFNGSLPEGLADRRQEFVNTFAEQARQQLFDSLFEPFPTPQGVAPGTNSNPPGSLYYALRWKTRQDAVDFSLDVNYEAWNWLSETIETDFSTLIQSLDESYVSTVYVAVSVPFSLVVDPDPQVAGVAASLVFSEGHVPEAPAFGKTGGAAQYVVTSAHPDTIGVQYNARVNFTPSRWPILEVSGKGNVSQGTSQIVLKPGSWIRRHTIFMYVRDGNHIKTPAEVSDADYLVLNVVYQDSSLSGTIRESVRITPTTPVEFSYPVKPGDTPGKAKISAIGVVGGKPMRSTELVIDPNEEAIFILVDNNRIQLVSKQAVLPEDDPLAQRLLQAGARPVVTKNGQALPETTKNGHSNGHLTGTPQAISEDTRSVSVSYDDKLELVPQPTDVSCWAASLTMVVSYRDQASYNPNTIASEAGMDLNTGYGWSQIQNAVRYWGLVEEGPTCALPEEWGRLLETYGPMWIVEVGAPYHAVVVGGIEGDGTAESTTVTIYNPWPPNVGAIEYKTFSDFDMEYGLGAGADAMLVHS